MQEEIFASVTESACAAYCTDVEDEIEATISGTLISGKIFEAGEDVSYYGCVSTESVSNLKAFYQFQATCSTDDPLKTTFDESKFQKLEPDCQVRAMEIFS